MALIYEKKGRIAYLTINRPQALNACDRQTYRELSEAWNDFRNDPNVWVAIITGAGERAFCAGSDVKFDPGSSAAPSTTNVLEPNMEPTITSGLDIWKPTIAAINGHANGGGLELALACDIRIASENAMFGMGEVKLGVVPDRGGTQRLPRTIPVGIALELLLTGRRIDAQEAYRIGLVNRVVPQSALMATAIMLAEEICENSGPLAVRAIKQAVISGREMPLEQGLQLEMHLSRIVLQTEDSHEGIRAFAEKRRPSFQAR